MKTIQLNKDKSEQIQYNNPKYPFYIQRGLLSHYPNFQAPPHWHEDIEFIIILSGEMQYNINGFHLTLKENEGLIINSKQLHYGYSNTKKECDFICIILHPILLCPIQNFENDFIFPIIYNNQIPFIHLDNHISWQNEILNYLIEMYSKIDSPTIPLKIQSLFFKIWDIIYENNSINLITNIIDQDLQTIKKMISFIQQNYQKKITLNNISKSGFVGQSKCCKLFQKYTGQTPINYLSQYRLDKSLIYLTNSNMSITEIALLVGFTNGSYFTETFHKKYNITPTKYRKKLTTS